jgi:hypothetical protein
MKIGILAACVAVAVAFGACNDVGDCPAAASAVTPGGSCSGDNLQCPYTLQTLSPACDGTTVEGGVATSCVCTSGLWVCPDAVTCPPAATGDDAAGTGDDSAGGGGDDSSTSEAGDDGGTE